MEFSEDMEKKPKDKSTIKVFTIYCIFRIYRI